ncbi:hypothetical protein B7R21_02550 [Subtercola boreus]|uniref:Septum formation-related domain-containing protein n=1 Tax=Subtercola boreus TaxID=120213 RepID=A0A3E0W3Z7_9MICO|nr:septum formation family protein [Subtercola boreus]RFA16278.1 hypothetical protein B7R21_02550 [Subtercola boreus]
MSGVPDAGRHRHAPESRTRRTQRTRWRPALLGALVVVVLAALFLAGTQLPGILNPPAALTDPSTSEGPTKTPTPTPTPLPTSTSGPQLAGTFEWFQLRGGECISSYSSAWQQRFAVVDCATPHGAQVVRVGTLGADPQSAFPGQSTIAQDLNLLCQQSGTFTAELLGAYPDVVWQASYPVTAEQWQAGQRNYSCFVSRSSSLPLVGSFAPPAVTG